MRCTTRRTRERVAGRTGRDSGMIDEGLVERMRVALIDQRALVRHEIQEQGADPDSDDVSFVDDAGFSDRSHSTQERSRLIAVVETSAFEPEGRRSSARTDRRRHVRPVRAVRQADRPRPTGSAALGAPLHGLQAEAVIGMSEASVPKVLLVVCDSWGVGDAPDAEAYGDEGADTLGNTARAVGGLHVPNLESLGSGTPHGHRRRRAAGRPRLGSRQSHRAVGRQGHHDRALGDDGDQAPRAVPAVPGRVPARDRGPVRGGDRAWGPRQRPGVGHRDHRGARRGAPADRQADRLHERRLRVPDRDAQGRRAVAHAVRVEPRRPAAAHGRPHGGPRDRPSVRRAERSVRPVARATGLLGTAAGPDRARQPAGARRARLRRRQDPRHLLRTGHHRGAVLGLERPRRRADARVPQAAGTGVRVHEPGRLRLEVRPPQRPRRLCEGDRGVRPSAPRPDRMRSTAVSCSSPATTAATRRRHRPTTRANGPRCWRPGSPAAPTRSGPGTRSATSALRSPTSSASTSRASTGGASRIGSGSREPRRSPRHRRRASATATRSLRRHRGVRSRVHRAATSPTRSPRRS